jgi:hypothetical protein
MLIVITSLVYNFAVVITTVKSFIELATGAAFKSKIWDLFWAYPIKTDYGQGLYYKNITIVNDAYRAVSEWLHN